MAKNTNYHRADVTLLQSENARLKEENAALAAQVKELKRKLEHMTEVFANAQRAQFGQSSEKRRYVLGEDQLCLFNEAETVQDHKAPEPTEADLTVKAHTRKKKRTLDQMMEALPVEEIILTLPEDRIICDKCGGTFRLIGKKLLRREMIIIPQQQKILAYYSCSYACDRCEKETGYAHILTTQAPPPLMKHSLASASTVADVMTKKYADGLPLARQEKIWARQGVTLSRATLANWVIQCAQTWLKPLYRHMKQVLLEEPLIHADETVVQVLKEEGKAATSESRMWLYASGETSRKGIRLFEYQPDRSGKASSELSERFYRLPGDRRIRRLQPGSGRDALGCWAHARRKWRDAMPDGPRSRPAKRPWATGIAPSYLRWRRNTVTRQPRVATSTARMWFGHCWRSISAG